jgi:hypothetical protein
MIRFFVLLDWKVVLTVPFLPSRLSLSLWTVESQHTPAVHDALLNILQTLAVSSAESDQAIIDLTAALQDDQARRTERPRSALNTTLEMMEEAVSKERVVGYTLRAMLLSAKSRDQANIWRSEFAPDHSLVNEGTFADAEHLLLSSSTLVDPCYYLGSQEQRRHPPGLVCDPQGARRRLRDRGVGTLLSCTCPIIFAHNHYRSLLTSLSHDERLGPRLVRTHTHGSSRRRGRHRWDDPLPLRRCQPAFDRLAVRRFLDWDCWYIPFLLVIRRVPSR